MNTTEREPGGEITEVSVDIISFVNALKEIADSDITSEVIKALLGSIHIKLEPTDDMHRNVHMLRMLSEAARSDQEFGAYKFLLAGYNVPRNARAMKRKPDDVEGKSEEQSNEKQPQLGKGRKKRNGSHDMKACRAVSTCSSVAEATPSTSQPQKMPKYQCHLCDNTLNGLSSIRAHYEGKHAIVDLSQILFYNGDALLAIPSSNVNTQGGTAPWFIREKTNATERHTVGFFCRLCEKNLHEPELLSIHYKKEHKIVDVTKLEQLFKFKAGVNLEGLPTSNPRKARQQRQARQSKSKQGSENKRRSSTRITSTTIPNMDDEESEDNNDTNDNSVGFGKPAKNEMPFIAFENEDIIEIVDDDDENIPNDNHMYSEENLMNNMPVIMVVKTEQNEF